MIVYHGSNMIVDQPKLVHQNRTLDFVFANRNGSYNGEHYDIVFGSVANDTIYRTFIAYEEGILTKDETLARLKVKKLFEILFIKVHVLFFKCNIYATKIMICREHFSVEILGNVFFCTFLTSSFISFKHNDRNDGLLL